MTSVFFSSVMTPTSTETPPLHPPILTMSTTPRTPIDLDALPEACCPYCKITNAKPMICCDGCSKWIHKECILYDIENAQTFICTKCTIIFGCKTIDEGECRNAEQKQHETISHKQIHNKIECKGQGHDEKRCAREYIHHKFQRIRNVYFTSRNNDLEVLKTISQEGALQDTRFEVLTAQNVAKTRNIINLYAREKELHQILQKIVTVKEDFDKMVTIVARCVGDQEFCGYVPRIWTMIPEKADHEDIIDQMCRLGRKCAIHPGWAETRRKGLVLWWRETVRAFSLH